MLRVLIVLTAISLAVCLDDKPDSGRSTDEAVFYINHVANTTWKATHNAKIHHPNDFNRPYDAKNIEKLFKMAQELPKKDHGSFNVEDLPQTFDARTKWPECPSLKEIRDQGACGSDWALGAVAAMTDRICIKSGGKKQVRLSAGNLLTCCPSCTLYGDGCHGGFAPEAWNYYAKTGIVSGGEHGSEEGCQPNPFEKCDHWVIGKYKPCPVRTSAPSAPSCSHKCREGYSKDYNKDLHFGKKPYRIEGEANIMKELVENGPVEATLILAYDFQLYKSGVYRHTSGPQYYPHPVKILGYGVEQGVKYWLVANSWNEDWGENGFFKILRGSNECGIESVVVAGEPVL